MDKHDVVLRSNWRYQQITFGCSKNDTKRTDQDRSSVWALPRKPAFDAYVVASSVSADPHARELHTVSNNLLLHISQSLASGPDEVNSLHSAGSSVACAPCWGNQLICGSHCSHGDHSGPRLKNHAHKSSEAAAGQLPRPPRDLRHHMCHAGRAQGQLGANATQAPPPVRVGSQGQPLHHPLPCYRKGNSGREGTITHKPCGENAHELLCRSCPHPITTAPGRFCTAMGRHVGRNLHIQSHRGSPWCVQVDARTAGQNALLNQLPTGLPLAPVAICADSKPQHH